MHQTILDTSFILILIDMCIRKLRWTLHDVLNRENKTVLGHHCVFWIFWCKIEGVFPCVSTYCLRKRQTILLASGVELNRWKSVWLKANYIRHACFRNLTVYVKNSLKAWIHSVWRSLVVLSIGPLYVKNSLKAWIHSVWRSLVVLSIGPVYVKNSLKAWIHSVWRSLVVLSIGPVYLRTVSRLEYISVWRSLVVLSIGPVYLRTVSRLEYILFEGHWWFLVLGL